MLSYATDYPFNHSLFGMVALGIGLLSSYVHVAKHKISVKDGAVLLAVTLSRFFLEISHIAEGSCSTLDDFGSYA
ncbi:hypothetical protein BDR05DRAFT_1063900 [Suillus weaverae]|nr:hypothetical protein BDR05DRAFT_1063900 [Suillus weaverae]